MNNKEVVYLFMISSVGILLNGLVCALLMICPGLRRTTNAFIIHGTILDILRCLYCIPFGISIQQSVAPALCNVLGGTYVMLVTAGMFNMLAAICCEAYTFTTHNFNGKPNSGTICCVGFGIIMVYIGSILIHLGPTIIGGDFDFNQNVGNCLFVYGSIKSYVAQLMWIVVLTLTILMACYVLVTLYRYVQANSSHRLTTLVRASVAVSRGDAINNTDIAVQQAVGRTLARIRIFTITIAMFIICWYPLLCLSMSDPLFTNSSNTYRLLAILAWSNGFFNPLILLLFDYQLNYCFRFNCCYHEQVSQSYHIPLMPLTIQHSSLIRSRSSSPLRTSHANIGADSQMYENIFATQYCDGTLIH